MDAAISSHALEALKFRRTTQFPASHSLAKKAKVMTIFDQGSRTAHEYMRQGQTALQEGWSNVERNYGASVQCYRDFNLKMVQALRSHVEATLHFAEGLATAKTPMDALGAWSGFIERQTKTFQKQAGEMVAIAQKGANENLQTAREAPTPRFYWPQ